jgi:16S rRNA (guanine527-N7)-methyltransferase
MDGSAAVDEVRRAAEALQLQLHASQAELLLAYSSLLQQRAVPLGMVSGSDSGRLLDRHVLDSLRAAPIVRDLGAGRVCDLGSGAGLPGVVLAVALPHVEFLLAEARAKRAAFLELAVERLGLGNATVRAGRVEDLDIRFDSCTARAFAPLPRAWESARRMLEPGGALVFFAGATERTPDALPGASSILTIAPRAAPSGNGEQATAAGSLIEGAASEERTSAATGSSARRALASGGDLVIITAQ